MVDRYEPEFLEEYDWTPIRKDADGDYVLFSEYDALLADVLALVTASNAIYNDACHSSKKAPSILYDNLKQAIAALEGYLKETK